jgi:hypothetical protein
MTRMPLKPSWVITIPVLPAPSKMTSRRIRRQSDDGASVIRDSEDACLPSASTPSGRCEPTWALESISCIGVDKVRSVWHLRGSVSSQERVPKPVPQRWIAVSQSKINDRRALELTHDLRQTAAKRWGSKPKSGTVGCVSARLDVHQRLRLLWEVPASRL